MADKRHLAPDGGYGWVIVSAYAFTNIINVPVYQGFTLLFRNVFVEMGLTTIDISMILNVNSSFGFLLGLFNGPLLKNFGYRKVGMGASLVLSVGYFLTSRAQTLTELIIFYGIMFSAGAIMSMSAFSLAVNTYFTTRRNRAAGLCMTATGLGPVFMPLVMSAMMKLYGERGTAMIFSALTLHTLAGTMLLQPVRWHYRKEGAAEPEEGEKLNEEVEVEPVDMENPVPPRRLSDVSTMSGTVASRLREDRLPGLVPYMLAGSERISKEDMIRGDAQTLEEGSGSCQC